MIGNNYLGGLEDLRLSLVAEELLLKLAAEGGVLHQAIVELVPPDYLFNVIASEMEVDHGQG